MRGAAELFVLQSRQAVLARRRFSIALAGGSTPQRAYELLAGDPFRSEIDWDCVHVFWSDERCVQPEDSRSNYRMAREALLDHVPVPRPQIHRIRGELPPEAAAREYQSALEQFFQGGPPRFDLALLGLGQDGHTASLFPGSMALSERRRWVVEIESPSLEVNRVSLTAPALNEAAVIAFLVAGSTKARVLAHVFQGPLDAWRLPAQLIRPRNGELCWMLDREAATLLNMDSAVVTQRRGLAE